MGYFKQKFRSIKKLPTWLYWFPARLMVAMLHTLYRVRVEDPFHHIEQARGAVAVTWHNRLMFFAAIFPPATRRRTVAVVSASRDGQYVADFIANLGLRSLRGSSTRGGAKAQLAALHAIRDGFNVSFMPDGPRGPRYVMKNGPIQLASLTGGGIIPISVNASRCWAVKSWDRFQIPKPFCRLTLVMGERIAIPPDLDAEGLEYYRKLVEDALLAITVDPVS